MPYVERDSHDVYPKTSNYGPGPFVRGANTRIGDKVLNMNHEHLGGIKEIMLDMQTGQISYAVLSHGGVFSIGEKLFAVPWNSLTLDSVNKCFVLNIAKDRFDNAPGFNSESWPDMADQAWGDDIRKYYDAEIRTS